MKKKSLRLSSLIAVLATLSGCVTMKQFDEVQMNLDRIAEENRRLTLSNQDGEIERRELVGRVKVLENSNAALVDDTTRLGRALAVALEDADLKRRALRDEVRAARQLGVSQSPVLGAVARRRLERRHAVAKDLGEACVHDLQR